MGVYDTQIVELEDDTELHISVEDNGIGIDHYESNMELISTNWIQWGLFLSIIKNYDYDM